MKCKFTSTDNKFEREFAAAAAATEEAHNQMVMNFSRLIWKGNFTTIAQFNQWNLAWTSNSYPFWINPSLLIRNYESQILFSDNN